MWIIIGLILFFFLVRPAWRVWKATSQAREQFRDIREAFERAQASAGGRSGATGPEEPRQRRSGWSKPRLHRKKIDPSQGDYIKYQDLQPASSPAPDTTLHYEVEEQVSDIEFTELRG